MAIISLNTLLICRRFFQTVLLAGAIITPADVWAGANELQKVFSKYQSAIKQERLVEAEQHAKEALELATSQFPDELEAISSLQYFLANIYRRTGRLKKSEILFISALDGIKRIYGTNSDFYSIFLRDFAELRTRQKYFDDAEELFLIALKITKKLHGTDHIYFSNALTRLANVYYRQTYYEDAELALKWALKIKKKQVPPNLKLIRDDLVSLGNVRTSQGRYSEAKRNYIRALDFQKKLSGMNSSDFGARLLDLGALFTTQRKYIDAEKVIKRSLSLLEKYLGPDHVDVGVGLERLAYVYQLQGRFVEAERRQRRSLEIFREAYGVSDIRIISSLHNLGGLLSAQGRYEEAEALYRQSFSIEKPISDEVDSLGYANRVNSLGFLYFAQGRYEEAEPLLKKSLSIMDKVLGVNDWRSFHIINNLAQLYNKLGRFADSEGLIRRGLDALRTGPEPDNIYLAQGLSTLSGSYYGRGLFSEAEPLEKQSHKLLTQLLRADHPRVAVSLNNLAFIQENQGHFAEAEQLYMRALEIHKNHNMSFQKNSAHLLYNLAKLSTSQEKYRAAFSYSKLGVSILKKYFDDHISSISNGIFSEKITKSNSFLLHAHLALMSEVGISRSEAETEAFEGVQLARNSDVGHALWSMASRFSTGDGDLERLVRKRQDQLNQIVALDRSIIEDAGDSSEDQYVDDTLTKFKTLARYQSDIIALDRELEVRFPGFKELLNPVPLALPEAQDLLEPREALVVINRGWGGDDTHVFVVRNDRWLVYTVSIGTKQISDAVTKLRVGVDLTNVRSIADLPHFNTEIAYRLYNVLLKPAGSLLRDVDHVIFVTGGALGALPVGLLVTEPQKSLPSLPVDYRSVPWLAKRFATTVIPSVSSLRALRALAGRARAPKPFVGFGDPLLTDGPSFGRGRANFANLIRGTLANVEEVRRLPSLPDTANELHRIAAALGANMEEVHLRERATETLVKSTDLSRYGVISFATHGLLSGAVQGLSEPALVLTPPVKATVQDDGLLTAGEVAQLKLNAEWVILSACNTAAGATPDADGLSGLAKAFFYAGSRALLVSHWPVSSDGTVRLVAGMFNEIANDNTVGRSEALRRSMLALMNDNQYPHYAHPAFWAPFSVIGEGLRW
jgi:CHAT domain-containing protein/Tfp pilus assembly protein PilF